MTIGEPLYVAFVDLLDKHFNHFLAQANLMSHLPMLILESAHILNAEYDLVYIELWNADYSTLLQEEVLKNEPIFLVCYS